MGDDLFINITSKTTNKSEESCPDYSSLKLAGESDIRKRLSGTLVCNRSNRKPSGKIRSRNKSNEPSINLKELVKPLKNVSIESSLFRKNPDLPAFPTSDPYVSEHEQIFTKDSFGKLLIHPHLVSNLETNFNVTVLTTIQKKVIPKVLDGEDILAKSQTGSGKTLSFVVPIIQKLVSMEPKISRTDGLFALIIVPTRELAIQIYDCVQAILRSFTWIVPAILIGGEKRKSEKARIRKGVNVLISTPGRLLDHLEHTEALHVDKVDCVVIDEADRLLELGYQKDITKILEILKKHAHQTILLSATLTPSVESLACLALNKPIRINANENEDMDKIVVPESLTHYITVVPTKQRLITLAAFLIQKKGKCIVFIATQDMVDYFNELFSKCLKKYSPGLELFKLHGNMGQKDRTEVFKKFQTHSKGILLTTDVCARGLDLSNIRWIVQYSATRNTHDYIHRVGRTARIGNKGSAVLFLCPHEIQFISMLQNIKINVTAVDNQHILEKLVQCKDLDGRNFQDKATALQNEFEKEVTDHESIGEMAKKAFVSYVRFYSSFPRDTHHIFNFRLLHLGHCAKSFGLRETPSEIGKYRDTMETWRERNKFTKPFNPERRTKRPRSTAKTEVSEFDSGFDGIVLKKPKK